MNRWECVSRRFDKNEKSLIGAEVGVYKGSMSKNLLKSMPNLFLFMIDRWSEYSESEKIENGNTSMSMRKQSSFDVAYEKVKKIRMKYYRRSGIINRSSTDASNAFKNKTFDFVFIDADHSYQAVKNDIKSWIDKIKLGGYICGHDYHRESVKKAVKEFFPINKIESDDDNTWFVKL